MMLQYLLASPEEKDEKVRKDVNVLLDKRYADTNYRLKKLEYDNREMKRENEAQKDQIQSIKVEVRFLKDFVKEQNECFNKLLNRIDNLVDKVISHDESIEQLANEHQLLILREENKRLSKANKQLKEKLEEGGEKVKVDLLQCENKKSGEKVKVELLRCLGF